MKYCDQRLCMFVSGSVCLSVCPLVYLKDHTPKLHEIFCTCYPWPWLGPSLMTMQYIMYTVNHKKTW